METFEVNPKSLKHLLRSIHERELALPDFQRNFVWQPKETEELVESIARNFPAGSLLFIAFQSNTFTPREIQNAPPLNGVPLQLILDGQQRLTSLYQAFFGTGDYRYFIDLSQLISDAPEVEEAVFYRHRNRAGAYRTLQDQADGLVLPLGELFGGREFDGWLDEVIELRPEQGNGRADLKRRIREARRAYITPIEEYRFPVVTLDRDTTLEAVCSIFETLNRTGVRLSVFELLAARFFSKGLDLRKLWARTREDQALIADFDVDEYYVLQAVALRAVKSVKRGDVLSLTKEDVEEHWKPVTHGFHSALVMLRDECGVMTGKWLPYGYMLVPMAALWQEAIDVAGPTAGANRDRMKTWFWCAALNARYDRAANTQAAKDFAELGRWFDGGELPEAVSEFSFDAERLAAITPRQQSIYKALMTLVLRRRVLDFHRAETLTNASIVARGMDDHHVFPKAYLNPTDEDPREPSDSVDSILNRTMIDRATNIRIGKRAPSDYLSEIRQTLTDGQVAISLEEILESHGLPGEAGSPLLSDDFAGFLDRRRQFFVHEIQSATGKPVAGGDTSEAARPPAR